jgi:GT2 family glycosyltransferase
VLAVEPSLFAADPRQLDWDETRLVHGHVTLRRGRLLRELLPGLHLDQTGDAADVVPTVMANGGCMLVRRSMALELGGFDETFFMDLEDLDLCWRAWLRGWGSVYVPDAWIRHHVGAVTTAEVLPRRLESSHHNLVRFALKCLPAREAAVVVAGELARMPRHRAIVARALGAIARELPEILSARRTCRPRRDLLAWMLAGQPNGGRPGAPDAGLALERQ